MQSKTGKAFQVSYWWASILEGLHYTIEKPCLVCRGKVDFEKYQDSKIADPALQRVVRCSRHSTDSKVRLCICNQNIKIWR